MASVKVKFSSVKHYASQCSDEYSMILNIAYDILSRAEKLYIIVQEKLEKISRQLNRVQRSSDEIQRKAGSYGQQKEDADRAIDRCGENIAYIRSHPLTVTTTDEEGHEITKEVIDYDSIRAEERKREDARTIYNLYANKFEDAQRALKDSKNMVNDFQYTKKAIELVSCSIQNDIYEIKKYIRAIEDEAEFNLHSLQGVIDSLQSYLASKTMFMPDGSYYEEFASASISSSTSQKVSKTVEAADEERSFIDHTSIVNNIDNWDATQQQNLIYATNLYLESLGETVASKDELEKVAQIIPNLIKNGAIVVHQEHANKRFMHIMEEDRFKTKIDVFRDSKKEIMGGGSYLIPQRIDGSKKLLGHVLDENAGSEISCCLVDSVDAIPHLVENYTSNYGSIVSVLEINNAKDSFVYCGGDSMDDLAQCNTDNSKINTFYETNSYHGVCGLVDHPTLGAMPCDAVAKLIVAMRTGEKIDSVAKYMEVTGKYVEVMMTKETRFTKHVSQVVLCPKEGKSKEELMRFDITKKIKEHKNVLWVNNQGVLDRLE